MSTSRKPEIQEVLMDDVEKLLARVQESMSEDDYELLQRLAESYAYLTEVIEDKSTTIDHLRKLLFGSKSEKTADVLPKDTNKDDPASDDEHEDGDGGPSGSPDQQPPAEQDEGNEEDAENKPKGHGRNGADAYHGAERVEVPHESLCSGDQCPKCKKGKVYTLKTPAVLVRITGQAPLQATVHELQRLRCNLCGEIFTAELPQDTGQTKYDATAASMIALLKYGSGLPFNRLGGLQGNLGIPLPPSTQWDIVNGLARSLDPVYKELIHQAAQGTVVHNDDTTMKILERMGKRREKRQASSEEDGQRRAVFTSGIISTRAGCRIALFFTGPSHAGENLQDVLAQRASELSPPIQMCDALSRNTSDAFQVILANCLAHGRRRFIDVAENFPDDCLHVLNALGEAYGNDAAAKERKMSPQERLQFHQAESQPVMEDLHAWMTQQIAQRAVEPNSGLGQAFSYMLKHWEKLTLFLRVPGAPLDNNICERALKKAILHRKNSLFYKTDNGARVGDLFMSLIHTCQLAGANAFEYLTELQRHIAAVAAAPASWMPWNYREALAGESLPSEA